MMEGINPPLTVSDAIYNCVATDGALFNGNTKLYRMAAEIFDDKFSSYMDNAYKEFDEELKSYSNRKIRLGPGQKNIIKAYIQWTINHISLRLNPTLTRFPVVNASDYIKR